MPRSYWPGIYPVPPVTPYMSPNFVPTAGYGRPKDLGFQRQMRRAWNDRYLHGAVWDDNPHGAVWDLYPPPQQFQSEFPPAPDTEEAIDAWLDADEELFRGVFGSADAAPTAPAPSGKIDLAKFKEAVFNLVKKTPDSPVDQAKQALQNALQPRQQPPLIVQTPAEKHNDTMKTVAVAGAITLTALGIGFAVGRKWGR